MTSGERGLAYLLGCNAAQHILLRALYCRWALERPDPEAFIDEIIEGILGSMDAFQPPAIEETDQAVCEAIETELRDFAETCKIRLVSLRERM